MSAYTNLADSWLFRLFKSATVLAAIGASFRIVSLAYYVSASRISLEEAVVQSVFAVSVCIIIWLIGRLGIYVKAGSISDKSLFRVPLLVSLSPMLVVVLVPLVTTTDNYKRNVENRKRSECTSNLKQIDGAVQQWALENRKGSLDACTLTDLPPYLKERQLPSCPSGGTYAVTLVKDAPTCTIHTRP